MTNAESITYTTPSPLKGHGRRVFKNIMKWVRCYKAWSYALLASSVRNIKEVDFHHDNDVRNWSSILNNYCFKGRPTLRKAKKLSFDKSKNGKIFMVTQNKIMVFNIINSKKTKNLSKSKSNVAS